MPSVADTSRDTDTSSGDPASSVHFYAGLRRHRHKHHYKSQSSPGKLMGGCASHPYAVSDQHGGKIDQYKAPATFQDDADRIRAFKSSHHADGTAPQHESTHHSDSDSASDSGGPPGRKGVAQRHRSSTKSGAEQPKPELELEQQVQPLPPGATPATPRESHTGDLPPAKPAAQPNPVATPSTQFFSITPPENGQARSSTDSAHADDSLSQRTPPASPTNLESGPAAGADLSPEAAMAKRRPTVTFEAAAMSDTPTPGTRGVVRNKSRLKSCSQPGHEPDSLDSAVSLGDELQQSRSVGGKRKTPPPPWLPVEPLLPAAKGGQSEPGLWVLRRTGNVRHKYILADALGRGQFGAVCVAMDRSNGERWACKSVSKRRVQGMHDFSMADVLREVEVLYTVGGHSGVVGLREVYEDDEDLHLIMEMCQGGDWFERLINFGRYTEAEAAATIRSVLEALSYCHSLGVMHRDIKPENIMFVDRTEGSAVKLTDFGLAALFAEGGPPLTEVLGSAYYVAPEVLRESYSKEADIWSTGVVLFIALGGYAPFDGANEREVFYKILHEPLKFKDSSWAHISADAKQVISWMLTKDPKQRASIKQLLEHPWFATCAGTLGSDAAADQTSRQPGSSVTLDPTLTQRMPKGSIAHAVARAVKKGKEVKAVPDAVVARLQQFSAMNAFKRQARRVLATYLPEEEVVGLMQVFQDMDKDGDGLLTMKELQDGLAERGVHITDKNARLMLQRADLDRDGAVDYGEFLAATLHLARLERDERLYRAFRYFDQDASGFITRDELESGLQHLGRVNVDKILAEVDKDGDGRICYTEFCDMLRHDVEPGMQPFSENESNPLWGAWGEHTESGRIVLTLPPDSNATSRQVSLANSRNTSINDRNSHSTNNSGAVSIRRSLGGNLLFGSRNARASHTGQGPCPSIAGRLSMAGGRALSLAGSSRFGSMRNAAYLAVNGLEESGRCGSQPLSEGVRHSPASPIPGLMSHRSAGLPSISHRSSFNNTSTPERHSHTDQWPLEVVAETDSSFTETTSSGITPSVRAVVDRPQDGTPVKGGHQQGSTGQQRASPHGPTSEKLPPSPFAKSQSGALAAAKGPATPTAWPEAAADGRYPPPVPRPSPRNAQQKYRPTGGLSDRSSSEHGTAARSQPGKAAPGAMDCRTNAPDGASQKMEPADQVLWRQIRDMAGATCSGTSPKSSPDSHGTPASCQGIGTAVEEDELSAARRALSCDAGATSNRKHAA